MPLRIQVTPNKDQLDLVGRTLSAVKNGAPKAIRAAMNDAIRSGRTLVSRRIREVLNLPAAAVNENVTASLAKSLEGGGSIVISYARVPLLDFKAKYNKRVGVLAQLEKAGPTQIFKHYFKATVGNGHDGIFARRPDAGKVVPQKGSYAGRVIKRGPRKGQPIRRQKIYERVGPSVVAPFEKQPGFSEDISKSMSEVFAQRLTSKVEWQLRKANPDVPDSV